jgi:hypothetical protein
MQQSATIVSHFADLADPRQSQNREHKLIDIMVIAIMVIAIMVIAIMVIAVCTKIMALTTLPSSAILL